MLGVDLDGEVRRVDPDRWLASRFIGDATRRSDVIALYAFDHELTRASAVTANPLMAEIRLTWWREALDEIYMSRPVRRHPAAEALAGAVGARSLPRAPLEAMIDARIEGLDKSHLATEEALAWAARAEGSVAALAAHVLGAPSEDLLAAPAGVVWGLIMLRRSGRAAGGSFDACLAQALRGAARAAAKLPASAFPAVLCATLARADLRSITASALEKRVRLTWAVLTGRL